MQQTHASGPISEPSYIEETIEKKLTRARDEVIMKGPHHEDGLVSEKKIVYDRSGMGVLLNGSTDELTL